MSLSLGHAWIRKTIRQPAARDAALQLLERAATQRAVATLIVGSRLSTNGKCYLVRWDGCELAVLEISRAHQADWKVNPHGLYQELNDPGLPAQQPVAKPIVSLGEIRLDETTLDGWRPMTGTCRFDCDGSQRSIIENGALRVQYFWPEMPRKVTAMWYADALLHPPSGVLRFCFPPLFSDKNPQQVSGTVALFLQLLTANDWVVVSNCSKISNVAAAFVTLR